MVAHVEVGTASIGVEVAHILMPTGRAANNRAADILSMQAKNSAEEKKLPGNDVGT